MSRPLRIEICGGWYHVTARGNERKKIFRDDQDHQRFLELLEEWVDRFGVRLHAYVLMENHYHLLVETPRANLTQAMQWLQVSYTVGFNRRHRRVGHLFQGRYKAIVMEEGLGWELSRYVHLNPVRVRGLGLSKDRQQKQRVGVGQQSSAQLVRERVEGLRKFRWSSYRSYIGLTETPEWLTTGAILQSGKKRGRREQRESYRRWVERAIREGMEETPWERLEGQIVLGGAELVQAMKKRLQGNEREQPSLKQMRRKVSFEEIKTAVEKAKGEKWDEFRDRHKDWGRDAALYLGRQYGGMRLRELAEVAGGIDYGSAQGAVHRFRKRLDKDKTLQRKVNTIKDQLFENET